MDYNRDSLLRWRSNSENERLYQEESEDVFSPQNPPPQEVHDFIYPSPENSPMQGSPTIENNLIDRMVESVVLENAHPITEHSPPLSPTQEPPRIFPQLNADRDLERGWYKLNESYSQSIPINALQNDPWGIDENNDLVVFNEADVVLLARNTCPRKIDTNFQCTCHFHDPPIWANLNQFEINSNSIILPYLIHLLLLSTYLLKFDVYFTLLFDLMKM